MGITAITFSDRPIWQTSVAPALLFALLGLALRCVHDANLFQLGVLVLVALLIMTTCLIAVAVFAKVRYLRREIAATIAIVAVGFSLLAASGSIRHQADFMLWLSRNRGIVQAARQKDGIIRHWSHRDDARDAYLVVDTRDASSSLAGAEAWSRRLGLMCAIAASERMDTNVYLVTTSACTLPTGRQAK